MSDSPTSFLEDFQKQHRQNQAQGQSPDKGGPSAHQEVVDGYVTMLDLELANGDHVALPYGTLLKIQYIPSKGIRMQFSTDDVVIRGHRLDGLYRRLAQHRVPRLVATGERSDFESASKDAVISEVVCEPIAHG